MFDFTDAPAAFLTQRQAVLIDLIARLMQAGNTVAAEAMREELKAIDAELARRFEQGAA